MYSPDQPTDSGAPRSAGRDGGRNARYSYLAGRLHSRQITMEEATDLFAVMQAMLQTSEAPRLAMMRASTAPSVASRALPPPPPERGATTIVASSGDDLLLVGLLAMGAGAGLLAAMTKRIQDVTTPSSPAARPQSGPPAGSG